MWLICSIPIVSFSISYAAAINRRSSQPSCSPYPASLENVFTKLNFPFALRPA